MRFMYLEVKRPQKWYNKVFRVKQPSNKASLLFLDFKLHQNGTTDVFRHCKATQKVLRMYLELS